MANLTSFVYACREDTRKSNHFEDFYQAWRLGVRFCGLYVDFDRVLMEGLTLALDDVSDDELPSRYDITIGTSWRLAELTCTGRVKNSNL